MIERPYPTNGTRTIEDIVGEIDYLDGRIRNLASRLEVQARLFAARVETGREIGNTEIRTLAEAQAELVEAAARRDALLGAIQ